MRRLLISTRRILQRAIRPELVVLDIYDFERTMERFLICHGEEIAENFFAPSPIMKRLQRSEIGMWGGEP